MNLLSEINQLGEDKYCMISLIYEIQKKINEQNKIKRDSQIQRTNGWLPEGVGDGEVK